MKYSTFIKNETPLFERRLTKDAILSVVLEYKYIYKTVTYASK